MRKGIDPSALFNLSYGMYVVGARMGDKLNAQIANAVMQVTADPACVAVCLSKTNFTRDCLCDCCAFSVSVLEEDVPMTFIGRFGFKSGRDVDKLKDVNYAAGELLVPVVRDWCLSGFEARIVTRVDVLTHMLFVGEVVSAEKFKDGTPLTYANYHLVKKGKSPAAAPTHAFNALKRDDAG